MNFLKSPPKLTPILVLLLGLSAAAFAQDPAPPVTPLQPEKDWTLLVFLNGKSDLDSWGKSDVNEMEQVGSNERLNVVVQWGSLAQGKTQRLYVQKDEQPNQVTSPVIQDMGKVDMGDHRELTSFIEWGAAHYPAKKYFVAVWNHGTGWHDGGVGRRGGLMRLQPFDISFDYETGNRITTLQLGEALRKSSATLGRKIDILGTDACLMAMAEVAAEIADSSAILVGSQEVEPGAGWAYTPWLQAWSALQDSSPEEVSRLLVKTYVEHYRETMPSVSWKLQLSALDLSRIDSVIQAVASLTRETRTQGNVTLRKMHEAMKRTERYDYPDSRDLIDFTRQLKALQVGVDTRSLDSIESAVREMVIANEVVNPATRASGLAIWLPTQKTSGTSWSGPHTFDRHAAKYRQLRFHRESGWGEALEQILIAAETPVLEPVTG